MGNRHIDPSIKEAYLEWLLVPPGQRTPSSKKDFSEMHDISHNTLLYWEKSEQFQQRLMEVKRAMSSAWYADILGGLFELSQNGPPAQRVAASKLLLDHLAPSAVEQSEDEVKLSEETTERITAILKEAGFK